MNDDRAGRELRPDKGVSVNPGMGDAWHRAWRLDGDGVTLVLAQRGDQLPEVVHWGAPLPAGEDPLDVAKALRRGLTGGTMDVLPPLSLLPEEGRSSFARPGLEAASANGRRWLSAFNVIDLSAGSTRFAIEARDDHAGLTCAIELVLRGSVLTGTTALTNIAGSEPILVGHLAAPVLPVPDHAVSLLGFGGRWIGEFDAYTAPITPGAHRREGRQGRTSHENFPGALCLGPGTGANSGEVWAFHLAWSGGHIMHFEELTDGRRHMQFGALTRPGEVILGPGETVTTPHLHAAYSAIGLTGIARAFQAHARATLARPRLPRPVTINSWEAVYFDHGGEKLWRLAEEASALGAERFVLDDGWFGRRDDDTTSLGDWTVDATKWPDGLGPFIAHVNALGMEFGLWFEPEMINIESELYRAHPDWLLADPAYPQLPGRHQFVLDVGRPEVRDLLFSRISAVLAAHPIAYVKWDHNRPLIAAAGADRRAGVVRQTEGFYALLERLIAAHPHVEFESCSGGGGRIDYGVLSRASRVWLSDSNDALERIRMQASAALFLPPEMVGSHVGPAVSHTSGRNLSMAFRATVAASRHMGLELDLLELDEAEKATLRKTIHFYKAHRALLHDGVVTILSVDEPDAFAELIASPDGGRFIIFAHFAKAPARASTRPFRLAGLEPSARYRLTFQNPEAIDRKLSRIYASPLLEEAGLTLSGGGLMGAGFHLPIHVPGTSFVVLGERVGGGEAR